MGSSRFLRLASRAAVLAILAGCGGDPPDREAPRPIGSGAPEGLGAETAEAPGPAADVPADPRMVLFDVQTALEAGRAAQGTYPVPDAFRYEERWRVQRQRLDAVFDGWDYTSDGETFRLRGTIDERAWDVSVP